MQIELRNQLINLLDRRQTLGITGRVDYAPERIHYVLSQSIQLDGTTPSEEVDPELMLSDLRHAYDYGREWICAHRPITEEWLIFLASKVMFHTGIEYRSMGGSFSAARGEFRLLNISDPISGQEYMSYQRIPMQMQEFCDELHMRRQMIHDEDPVSVYELSFWAHFQLITIHPWADGNGRMARLLMNMLQLEHDVPMSVILPDEKMQYIDALIEARRENNPQIFISRMAAMHCAHLQSDIDADSPKVEEKQTPKTDVEKSVEKRVVRRVVDYGPEVPKTSERIIAAMRSNPYITIRQLERKLGLSRRGIEDSISRLKKRGRVIREGSDNGGCWRVKRR